jgi:lipopolysaccharide transport system permease protein
LFERRPEIVPDLAAAAQEWSAWVSIMDSGVAGASLRMRTVHATGAIVDIEPASRWPRVAVAELWTYRELLFFLVWRDVKVRYAQTVLGAGWTVVQPLLTMAVFTVVFGRLAKIPSDGVPYAVFSLTALIPWNYFSSALTTASSSLVSNARLISKVYFPRLIVPLSSVLSGLVGFAITLVMLLAAMLMLGLVPRVSAIVVLPVLLVIMMMIAAGVGCWLGALAVQYRDIQNVTAFIVHLWMYACPVVYPLSLVPERYRSVYLLNPMVGVIEGFRSALLATTPLPLIPIGISACVSAVLLVSGVLYFRRMEQTFADVA